MYGLEHTYPKVLEDYLSLKNAILLIAALKKERIYREVYLLDDSIHNFEKKYKFLMSSHLKRFKKMFSIPFEESTGEKAFHSG